MVTAQVVRSNDSYKCFKCYSKNVFIDLLYMDQIRKLQLGLDGLTDQLRSLIPFTIDYSRAKPLIKNN